MLAHKGDLQQQGCVRYCRKVDWNCKIFLSSKSVKVYTKILNISKSTATNRCMFVWVGDFYKDSYLRESRYVTKCLLIKTYHSHLKTLRDYIPTLLRDLQIVMWRTNTSTARALSCSCPWKKSREVHWFWNSWAWENIIVSYCSISGETLLGMLITFLSSTKTFICITIYHHCCIQRKKK